MATPNRRTMAPARQIRPEAADKPMGDVNARRAPAEILETIDRGDGRLVTRYRWHVAGGTYADGSPMAPSEGEDWASGPVVPLPREILEDRWRGLLHRQDQTKLSRQLDQVLARLADGLTRRDIYSERAIIDGDVVDLDMVMDIDGLEDVIRDWMLERAGKVAGR